MVGAFIEPPLRKARLGGIKGVAEFRGGMVRLGTHAGLEWMSAGCMLPVDAPGLCYQDSEEAPQGTKDEFDGWQTLPGLIDNFAGYAGVDCFLQADEAGFLEQASSLLLAGEDRFVERHLVAALDTYVATPETAADLREAVAEAEQDADRDYIGLPVIIVSRASAILGGAGGDLFHPDTRGGLVTANGTPVVATSAVTLDRVYVTGAITVAHSETVANFATNQTLNHQMAIAERVYGLALDCGYANSYNY